MLSATCSALKKRGIVRFVLLGLVLLLCPAIAPGDVEEVHYFVQVGDKAPEFTGVDDQGKKWRSTTWVGKKILVLCWYEGDFFPNCTRQALELQSVLKELRAEGAELVGISGDSPANHRFFKKTNKLSYTLLADTEGKIAFRFGVTRSGGGVQRFKDKLGDVYEIRRSQTLGRWTFIIGRDGKVAYKKMDVTPAGHAKAVLSVVRRLNLPR